MKTSTVKQDFVMPILVLTLICLFISGALALTNMATEPTITAAAAARAEQARKDVLPDADGFEAVSAEGLPESVTGVYEAANGVGYVFMLSTNGYGGEMELICGIGTDGRIVACQMLDHGETQGIGAKAADEPFRSQFAGKDASLEGVEAISGATVTSKAYMGAIADAFAAYDIVKGG